MRNKYSGSAYRFEESRIISLQFDIIVPENAHVINILAICGFESICVAENNSTENNLTTSVGRHKLRSVSMPSNMLNKPRFVWEPKPGNLGEFGWKIYINRRSLWFQHT